MYSKVLNSFPESSGIYRVVVFPTIFLLIKFFLKLSFKRCNSLLFEYVIVGNVFKYLLPQ